jgi:SET domain-containing protein
MIPLIDMASHCQSPNCMVRRNDASDCYELVALREIHPGAELLINYGDFINMIKFINKNHCTMYVRRTSLLSTYVLPPGNR